MTKPKINARGFGTFAEFTDTYGAEVRVHESSADPLDKVWVFVKGGELQAMHPDDPTGLRRLYLTVHDEIAALHWQDAERQGITKKVPQSASAHLNVKQAKTLIAGLQAWVDSQAKRRGKR